MAIKVRIEEDVTGTHSRVTVDRDGAVSSALMPNDPDEDEVLELTGDVNILWAATGAWNGRDVEFEVTDEELARDGGGYWAP